MDPLIKSYQRTILCQWVACKTGHTGLTINQCLTGHLQNAFAGLLLTDSSAKRSGPGYALARWDALCRFLEDGRSKFDNTPVERAIRPVALGRKNHLFAGSDGGKRWAMIASLIETARLNGVETYAYPRDVFEGMTNRHPHEPHRRPPALELDTAAHQPLTHVQAADAYEIIRIMRESVLVTSQH